IPNLLSYYLKKTNRDYLLPFVNGLANIGRPSNVLFPPELLEQALSLVLSGLNNTMAIQSNLHWVWPYWVEKQHDPDAPEFVPTGVNVITINLTSRNWTSISLINSRHECMVDPVGMLTLFPFSWSIFPYILFEEQKYIPPLIYKNVKQELFNGTLPQVITKYDVNPEFKWTSEIEILEAMEEELAIVINTIENISDRNISLVFGISIRPYNSLTIGHINNLKFKNNLWRVNGKPGILLLTSPDHTGTSDRFLGDPILTREEAQNLNSRKSKSGIIGGISEYIMSLRPKEKKKIVIVGVIGKRKPVPNRKFKHITLDVINKAKDENIKKWLDWEAAGLTLTIPDKRVEKAFYAIKNHLTVFDDKDYFTAGTFVYHTYWIRDGSFIALAYENLGMPEYVIPKLRYFMKQQNKDGSFISQNGEWDGTGQVIFTTLNHIRRSGNLEMLNEFYPNLIRGVRWIETFRITTKLSISPHFGMLPAGMSAEHFGPNDHYFWDNFWSLSGIKLMLWAAQKLKQTKDLEWLIELYEDYHDDINSAIAYAMRHGGNGEVLPCSPYRLMDSASVGNLIAVTPLDIYDNEETWLLPTVDFLWEHNIREGLFFQKIIHTGLNVYLSLQLAKTLLILDDKRWQILIEAILNIASSTYTWPEAINPRTKGGCMGDGDHGWAASEFINFVRDMCVVERNGELFFGIGFYDEWYKDGLNIEINNASTFYGIVNYSIKIIDKELSICWSIKRKSGHEHCLMFFLLPKSLFNVNNTSDSFSLNKTKITLIGDEGKIILKIKES
ncbi:MAG: hypothetical protein HQK93_01540, partial [Nitrospirae bacterium]|nr:hypothetical protein [Nitrospirota bacterium]